MKRVYVRRLDAIYDVVNELTNQGINTTTIEEFAEKVAHRVAEIYQKRAKKSNMYGKGGKARYFKTTYLIGKTLGLLRPTEDGKIELNPMDEHTFNLLAGIFLGNVKEVGGLKRWENLKMVEDIYNYTGKDTLTIEEFIKALTETGWVSEIPSYSKFLTFMDRLIIEMLSNGVIEILENGDIKIKILPDRREN